MPPQKYLFDRYDFGTPKAAETPDDLPPPPPPPPSFSEEELSAARAASFAQGHAQGLAEAAASREQRIAELMAVIQAHLADFTSREQEREHFYERESVAACLAVLENIIPSLAVQASWGEIERVLQDTLAQMTHAASIAITVPADCLDEVRRLMETGALTDHANLILKSCDQLGPGSCRIEWETGGASRDSTAIFHNTLAALRHVLASEPKTNDNIRNGPEPSSPNET